MLSINTNLSSLIAQNSMSTSTLNLNQAIERMTTGYKINHAKDNAANYSIATNMDTKIGALQVAEENVMQGMEMMSTTSECLSLIEDKLLRMRALTVQAQNGVYGTTSLNAISAEAKALLLEINRINESASYNGIKLFNTGKADVTNAGKELELNEQGFLQDVVKVDTTGMTKLSDVDPNAILTVGEYTLSTKEELVQLKEMSDAGLLEPGSTFILSKNIDMSGVVGWNGIGEINHFRGVFNGNGFIISNLTGTQGLFQEVDSHSDSIRFSEIKNVRLENVNIETTDAYVGAICGKAQSVKINNCSVSGSVVAKNQTGGILGYGYYGMTNYCYYRGDVVGNTAVGGISGGNNYSESYSCFFEGSVSGNSDVGGIAGWGEVLASKAIANIKGKVNVGGISGSKLVSDSYYSGMVQGDDNVGGIVGETSQNANGPTSCIMDGTVNGQTNVGILVGNLYNGKIVKDCYYYAKGNAGLELAGTVGTGILNNNKDITVPCDYTLQVGTFSDEATSSISCTTYIDFAELKDLFSIGIENSTSIEKVDALVNAVSLKQTELGMLEQRLSSVLDEIAIQYENLVSSRSTIRDADIAEVSSDYIRQQILQQASATLMSTANQSPAIALQLI